MTAQPLTRRATMEFRRSTAAQRESGAAWYADANAVARDQANEYGVTIETTSGIIAALSPRLGWGSNVALAERMLASHGTLDRGGIGRSLSKARRIYAGAEPLDVLGGPKTRAFYQAILSAGEEGDAVIDRHAWDMLVGKRQSPAPNLGQYRAAADAMQRAAKILGVSVHETQATTWLAWRSRFWSASAFAHKPQPMLEGAQSW